LILFHKSLGPHFSKFGIDIPIDEKRADKVFEKIKHPFKVEALNLQEFEKLSEADLRLVHDETMVSEILSDQSDELFRSFEKAYEIKKENFDFKKAQGLRDQLLLHGAVSGHCIEIALTKENCFFLGGGMHHAMEGEPRGFCLFNDIAIGIKKFGSHKKILIVDLDAHKGDGSAQIFQHEKNVKTLSLHMKEGWPLDNPDDEAGVGWRIPSDLDIEFRKGEEGSYLERLEEGLGLALSWESFDLVVVVWGADTFEHDNLESAKLINLSREDLKKRDEIVLSKIKKLRSASFMGGGYGSLSHEIFSRTVVRMLKEGLL